MIAAARPRWSRYRRGPSANAREAVDGDKKESQRQDQGKAQEDLAHRGDYPQQNQEGQKKTGEEAASPARNTKESQAARERRAQPDAGYPAGTARTSHANTPPPRTTPSAGGAYRRRDQLLQPPVSRDPAAR